MPITYDSSTNTIVIVGGSETNPYTFEDIYQANQANGWGVVEKKESAYFIHAIIQLGDGDNDAWLVDKNKQLFFYANYAFKNPSQSGHLVLGEIENEEERTTRNGCYVECYGNYFTGFHIQEINLFDTKVVSRWSGGGSFSYFRVDSCIGKIWNSELHSILLMGNATDLDIYSVELGNFAEDSIVPPFMYFDVGSGSMEKITVVNCAYAAIHFWDAGFTIKNLVARNIRNALVLLRFARSESFAIDWEVDWSRDIFEGNAYEGLNKLWRQYSFNVRVQDERDNPISGAKVVLKDNNGNIVYSEITNESGRTPIQILNWGYYTLDGSGNCIEYPSTPHTLIVTKQGYRKYEAKIELTKKLIDFPVVLEKEIVNIDQEVLT